MTHTLHPEIAEKILRLSMNIWNISPKGSMDIVKDIENMITQYLSPYLHMPQPIENEPSHQGMTASASVENKGGAYADPNTKPAYSVAVKLENEPLEKRLRLLAHECKSEEEFANRAMDLIDGKVDKEPLPEQTTPKIEKIELILEGTRPTNTLLTDANMSRIDTMLSQIIDHINNNLPTKQ